MERINGHQHGRERSVDKARTWANVNVDEVYKKVRQYVHSVDVLVGVHVVKRHAIIDVKFVLVIRVVIGVFIVVLSVPLIVVHFVVPILIL